MEIFWISIFLSSTAEVFLGLPVQHPLPGTPVVSFFFRTFQMVVLATANVCLMALIDFPPSLNFKYACFSPIDSSLDFMLSTFLTLKRSLQNQNRKLRLECRHSVVLTVLGHSWAAKNTCQSHVLIILGMYTNKLILCLIFIF